MTDNAFINAFDAGRRAQQQNDFAAAIKHYSEALAIDGENAGALSLYGIALVQAGRAADAEAPLMKAIEIDPNQPGFRVNLAEFYRGTGEFDRAIALLKDVTSEHPAYAQGWIQLGEAHISKQEFEPGADALDEALQIDSGNQALALRLTRALAAADKFPEALGVLDHADKITPDSPEVVALRIAIATLRRDWSALEEAAEHMTRITPNDPTGWRNLSIAYYERGLYRGAMQAFQQILERGGRNAENVAMYGRLALQAGRLKEAAEALDEAEKLGADGPDFLTAQTLHYIIEGRFDEAEKNCERVIASHPQFVQIYPSLSALRKGRLKESEQSTLAALVENETFTPAVRATASFVLAHGLDADGDFDAAFAEYRRANDIGRSDRVSNRIGYSPAIAEKRINSILERFSDPELYEVEPVASDENRPTPVFILGAPRSGTTLVETVIGAHSKVAIGGELPMTLSLLNEFLDRGEYAGPLSQKEREAYVKAYWREAPPTDGAAFMTDKGMLSMDAVGLIAQMFPKAPIIYVRRNPLEAGLSIFRHEFTKFWAFTDSLEHIGHYLGESERMASRWQEILGDRMTTIQHETFVENFDAEARRLIASCGLDWEDECAERGGAGKTALTISAVQVREPIELQAGRAKAYEKHLGLLRNALEAANIDLDTGALKA